MPEAKSQRKKTAFVPRVLFRAVTAAGVVPACALSAAACGGLALEPGDASPDTVFYGVAREAFDALPGVALACFDGGGVPCNPPQDGGPAEAGDASTDDAIHFTVAAACFDGGPYCPDAKFGVADTGFGDVYLGVAADAFGLDSGKG